jgi:hypothetical protein
MRVQDKPGFRSQVSGRTEVMHIGVNGADAEQDRGTTMEDFPET